MSTPRPIELLAPARDAETAIEAIRHGADAVYIGAESHGARSSAANSTDDLRRVVNFAHRFNARVYVTLNTLIYDSETTAVERLVADLYRIGVDALIVQDMALLRMKIPPIALHASTQCDIRDPEKAEFLADAGFSQLVLARELSLEETAAIHSRVKVPLEAFVHGALCVSYSGDCQAGFATMGRSANRGECPQICRHRFDLTDGDSNVIISGKHLLSLRDLNRSELLSEMLEAGISSFKIEGRLKDKEYVKNVVGAYRRLLDNIIAANPDKYVRSSAGTATLKFRPDLNRCFNRGYTEYFSRTSAPGSGMASADTPKWIGLPVGTVTRCHDRKIKARLTDTLSNGDGLGYFNTAGEFCGFRLNRIEGNTLIAARSVDIPAGCTIYRNSDRLRHEMLEGDTADRRIDIGFTLRTIPRGLALDITDETGLRATVTADAEITEARTPQTETRRELLSKTGDTIYHVTDITDTAAGAFIPRSLLADLRRRAVDALERARRCSYRFEYRKPENASAHLPKGSVLTYHDNVANSLARKFYSDHGAAKIAPAIETDAEAGKKRLRVMTSRYCLRRESGHCLKTSPGKEWPRDLYLVSGPIKLKVEFDCSACRMHIYKEP